MNELALIRPWWLLAIPPALAFVWWLRRRHGRGGGWESIVDPTLLPHLVVGAGGTRREWPWIVMAVAIAVAGLALAGPAFEVVERSAFRSLAARVIVLDASRSMDARDLPRSRMVHARHKVSDLLRRSRDRRTGLVVFAGDAFVVAPLTRDADTLVHLLSATDTSVVPVQGSRPDLGLLAAGRLLERGHATAGEIVLVTDGETKPMARDAAERLAARGISVSILAVGTREGAPIPLAEGRFLERPGGEIVVPRVDIEALRAVAEAGTGRFATITADDADVEWLLGTRTAIPWRATLEETGQTSGEWRDEGPWLVLLLLPMAALAFRRGWLLVCPLALSVTFPDAAAFELADLWERRDRQTARAIEQGDLGRAAAIAPDHRWLGTAHYRAGRFHQSAEAFAVGDTADDHYNRGNALARVGDLRGALDAYREALARQPSHADAEHNRSIVESQIANAPQRRRASNEGGEGEAGAGEEPISRAPPRPLEAADSEDKRGRGDAAARERGESRDGELVRSGRSPAGPSRLDRGEVRGIDGGLGSTFAPETMRDDFGVEGSYPDEARLAYEQWLRRIPDDPGGLLRRKFALEYRSRGANAPISNELW